MSKHDKLCYKGEDGQWWDMSCTCDYIATVKKAERERIIKLLTNVESDTEHYKYGSLVWTQDIIDLIKGEQK